MGRGRKAWVHGGNGVRIDRGHRLPGYYARFSDYASGRRVNRTKRFSSLKAARMWVRRFNAAMELRLLGEVIPIAMDDAAAEYISGGSSWAPATLKGYAISLGLLTASVGNIELRAITPAHIDRFISDQRSTPATIAKHLRGLGAFFTWAKKRQYMLDNPIEGVTSRPRRQHERVRPAVSEQQLANLVELADTPDRRLGIALAMSTGMDRGALIRLAPEWVDRDRWTITFKRQKTGKVQTVPVPDVLVPEILTRLVDTQPGRPLLHGLSHQGDERDWWHALREKAGLPSLMFRDLRAIAASRLQRAGATARDSQQLLGHASVLTTLSHYYQADPELERRLKTLPVPGFPAPPESTTG